MSTPSPGHRKRLARSRSRCTRLAARDGRPPHSPRGGSGDCLVGRLEMPLAVGTVQAVDGNERSHRAPTPRARTAQARRDHRGGRARAELRRAPRAGDRGHPEGPHGPARARRRGCGERRTGGGRAAGRSPGRHRGRRSLRSRSPRRAAGRTAPAPIDGSCRARRQTTTAAIPDHRPRTLASPLHVTVCGPLPRAAAEGDPPREHAVVHGRPALVVGLARQSAFAWCLARSRSASFPARIAASTRPSRAAAAFAIAPGPGCDRGRPSLPVAVGLGSSAALSVALVRAARGQPRSC